MAAQIRVSCINKTDRTSAHERIKSIGGTNPDGRRWRLPESQAIQDIKSSKYTFHVERPAGRPPREGDHRDPPRPRVPEDRG
jgi:hypothetical protein